MEIQVSAQKAQQTVAYREHATMENMVAMIDKGLNMAYDHLKALGKQPVGAPYCCYTNVAENDMAFDLEMGFPIGEELPVKDGLVLSKTHEGKTLEATHKGSYQSLEATYGAMMQYAQDNGLSLTGVYYDWYLNDPDNTPEDELLTKVVFILY